MSIPAIIVEDLSKLYRIGLRQNPAETFAGVLWSWLKQPARNLRNLRRLDVKKAESTLQEEGLLWALRHISFRIEKGERLGIIGPNGAGKTTLLKILSRITEPSGGRVLVRGKVGSLLEVGVGFHPELTGRENVFLNGAILGMRRHEIRRQFDEIVAFAEVERFIDTPVKRYSSGMFVRLAFAVAAHLDTDILLVDEVLAVGDAAFQRRCLGKMNEVASQGRTVLFVSHQLSLVRSLCERSILVRDGCLAADGTTAEIVDQHLQSSFESSGTGERLFPPDPEKAFQLLRVRLLDQDEEITTFYSSEDTIVIELLCSVRRRVPGLYGYMTISRNDGTIVIESDSYDRPPNRIDALPVGDHLVVVKIPPRTLAPGRHLVYFNFTSPSGDHGFQVDSPGMIDSFEVTDPFTRRGNKRQGYTGVLLEWQSGVTDSKD